MTLINSTFLPPDSPQLPVASYFHASDGYELGYRLWMPERSPRSLVIFLHGIQSHSGWYGASSARLAEAGHVVAYLDRRGSGVNALARGDASHHERLINDVIQFIHHLSRIGYANLPRVLGAVSWGGKLATAVALRHPNLMNSLLLITPGICAHVRANALQRSALQIAHKLGAHQRLVPIPLDDPALFTSSPAHQQFIRDDPLTLRKVTLRFLATNIALDAQLREPGHQLHCRTLVMLAGKDRIVDNDATRRFFAAICSTDASVFEYPSAVHTLEFENDRDRFVSDMLQWLETNVT